MACGSWSGGALGRRLRGRAEKASIDEAFIDFTRPVKEELLKRYPHLATVPPDAPNGIDTPLPPPPPIMWGGLGTVVPVNPPNRNPEKQDSAKEKQSGTPGDAGDEEEVVEVSKPVDEDSSVEEDDELTTWHDVALSIAAELMLRIREDIRTKLGYTTSAVSTVHCRAL